MNRETRTHIIVAAVTALAAVLVALAWDSALPFPGWWAFASFLLIAFLLESFNTQLRVEATGSTSFIMHIAAGLLFGGFWSSLIAGLSTMLGELARGNQRIMMVFNVSQRVVSVAVAVLLY